MVLRVPRIKRSLPVEEFALDAEVVASTSITTGLINETHRVTLADGTAVIMQRINPDVFPQAEAVMKNISIVLQHVQARDAKYPLKLVPTRRGGDYVVGPTKGFWRCYPAIEGAGTVDKAESIDQARAVASGFAGFLRVTGDLDTSLLTETIPDFHNTPKRYDQLEQAIAEDVAGRLAEVGAEIDYLREMRGLASRLQGLLDEGELPLRTVHNDTKINNVMLDDTTGNAVCVIDLDTVMPGLVHHDYGDLVRTAASTEDEGSGAIERVALRTEYAQAIEHEFLEVLGDTLTARERETLPLGPVTITLELATRFLADYLSGDRYFRLARPGHNLERTRNQIALAKSMMAHLPKELL